MLLLVAGVLTALLISFLCSLFEAVLLSLTPVQIADISTSRPRLGSIWQGFKANIERPITVILVLNSSAITIGAAIGGSQFNKLFGGKWIWLFSLVFTFAVLQFAEILPKIIGVRFNRTLAGIIVKPLTIAITVFEPIIKLVEWLNKPFSAKAGRTP